LPGAAGSFSMLVKWLREQSSEIVNFLSHGESEKRFDALLGQTNAPDGKFEVTCANGWPVGNSPFAGLNRLVGVSSEGWRIQWEIVPPG